MTVGVSLSADHSRVAFRIGHTKGNIITADVIEALRGGIAGLAENPHLKLVTIEGEGGDFSFGASIPEHGPEHISRVLPSMHALIDDWLDIPAVTAAVVRGRCLGGGFELALACDLIFAAADAEFGLPEIALGVFPPAAAVLLPARVGLARAARAVLTGEKRSVDYWTEAGLFTLVAPHTELAAAVDAWFVEHLQTKSAAALRHAAVALRGGLHAEVRQRLPELERLYLDELMGTHDAKEGVQAFLEKRAPRWRDG